MSQNEESIIQEPVPSWAQEILFRLCNLESQAQNVTAPSYASATTPTADSIDMSDNETGRDLYIVDRAPPRDLLAYPQLLDSIPSIKNDFFRSPLTDAARRKFIGLCPKNESMVYEPPSLNEFGLSHEAKKDFQSSSIFTSHNNEFRNAKIPGKAPQILSASSNPLFDPKELVEHVASNKAIHKANVPTRGANKLDYSVRRSVFQRKFPDRNYIQPQLANLPSSSSLYGQKQLRQEGGPNVGNQDSGAVRGRPFGHRGKGGKFRTGFSRDTRILFDDVYSSKKIRRNSHSFKSETSESASASKVLQNGESVDCMQTCSPQRLDNKHRSCRRIPSSTFFSIFKEISQFSMEKQKLSLPRSSIWPFLEPTSFHESIAPSSQMGKTAWDKDKYLPGRFVDLRIEQGRIAEEHTESGETPKETGIYNSGKGILIGSLTKPNSSGNENQYTINVVRNTKRQGQGPEEGSKPPHNQGLCEEKRRDPVSCSAQGLRAVVGPLSEFFDSPTAELRPFCTQYSRCSFKDGYIDGMVNIRQDIQEDKYEVRTTRCGYVRSPGEPQTAEICQLETIARSSSNGRFQSSVEYLEEYILLSTLESHHEDNPEGPQREINLDPNNSLVENRDLVPGSNQNFDREINQNTSRRSAPGIFKRKFDNVEEQGLVTYSLEDKRKRYNSAKKKFMIWRSENCPGRSEISVVDIINFLDNGRVTQGW
ncbi:hypothetical protein AYI69_g9728 [Smittium culicis]|uniref:Uncharacterized protein n=1 Tax=Smittium culicis TaxID=133412 RepID=A0A1R1XAP7_9FUNG|nr:hypothetical protein AYI69_g9728 [Smittium culicis]